MADCFTCRCNPTSNCADLHQDNDDKLREFALHYKNLETCDLAEQGAKGFYNVWCLIKSILAIACEGGGGASGGGGGVTRAEFNELRRRVIALGGGSSAPAPVTSPPSPTPIAPPSVPPAGDIDELPD